MRHGSEAPEQHGHGIAPARPQAIDQIAHGKHADRIGELEREHDVAVINFIPAEIMLKRRLQDAKHLAIHVVLGRPEEQQSANEPAEAAYRGDDPAVRFRQRGSHFCCAPSNVSVCGRVYDGLVWIIHAEIAWVITCGSLRAPSSLD